MPTFEEGFRAGFAADVAVGSTVGAEGDGDDVVEVVEVLLA